MSQTLVIFRSSGRASVFPHCMPETIRAWTRDGWFRTTGTQRVGAVRTEHGTLARKYMRP